MISHIKYVIQERHVSLFKELHCINQGLILMHVTQKCFSYVSTTFISNQVYLQLLYQIK